MCMTCLLASVCKGQEVSCGIHIWQGLTCAVSECGSACVLVAPTRLGLVHLVTKVVWGSREATTHLCGVCICMAKNAHTCAPVDTHLCWHFLCCIPYVCGCTGVAGV